MVTISHSSPKVPETARITNVSVADAHNRFILPALEPIQHCPAHVAPIYAHDGNTLHFPTYVSTRVLYGNPAVLCTWH